MGRALLDTDRCHAPRDPGAGPIALRDYQHGALDAIEAAAARG